MSYVEENLGRNEKIILTAKPHWLGAASHALNGTELAI